MGHRGHSAFKGRPYGPDPFGRDAQNRVRIAQTAARLKEAQKLGFTRAFVPDTTRSEAGDIALSLTTLGPLLDLVANIAPEGRTRRRAGSERPSLGVTILLPACNRPAALPLERPANSTVRGDGGGSARYTRALAVWTNRAPSAPLPDEGA